jgi:endonuclease YncB( thermonuclease family)
MIIAAAALAAAPACAASQAFAAGRPSTETTTPAQCTLKAGDTHTVVAIVDAQTLELDDGSNVRLAGIVAPIPPAFLTAGAVWLPEAQAIAGLKQLLLGETVELAYAAAHNDRWGRRLAHVFRTDAAGREWVQGWLLRQGHARVDPLPDSLACIGELLAHERQGMQADRGLWTNPAYRIRWADTPQRLMRLRNTFQLIEGSVRKVAVTRGRVYVNFGDDWRNDFTAGASHQSPAFDKAALAQLQNLEGKRVRVRGWIERRNGPYVELFHPLQIETLDGEQPPASTGVARGTFPPGTKGPTARVPAEAQPRDDPDIKKRPEPEVPDALDL